MKEFTITVPYPISVNRYLGRHGNRTFLKKEGIEFKDICRKEVLKTLEIDEITPTDKLIEVEVVVYPKLTKDWVKREKKDPLWYLELRTLDLDNCNKVLLDAFNKFVYTDDKNIFKLKIERGYPVENGATQVTFKEYIIKEPKRLVK